MSSTCILELYNKDKEKVLIRIFSSTATQYSVLTRWQNLNRFPALIVILLDFAQACGLKDSEESKSRIESSVNSNVALSQHSNPFDSFFVSKTEYRLCVLFVPEVQTEWAEYLISTLYYYKKAKFSDLRNQNNLCTLYTLPKLLKRPI